MNSIVKLKNFVQEYEWGSKTFIPELLGELVPSLKPKAELWIGAHPKAPSQVSYKGGLIDLRELIGKNPKDILGKKVAEKYSNELPFLLKVLSAAKPLSIQAHPSRDQALKGFDNETRLEIPLEAPHRNYRDINHKPEIFCALTPFTALKGFRKIEEIISNMGKMNIPPLNGCIDELKMHQNKKGLKKFFSELMTFKKDIQREIVNEAVIYTREKGDNGEALKWIVRLNNEFPGDIGAISPLFLNLIHLRPTDALFIPDGELHAYLEGSGIELMANSDNVLRGGLTNKHVDVPELLKTLSFADIPVEILKPEESGRGEKVYYTPVEEFALSVISLDGKTNYESPAEHAVEILICTEGTARLSRTDFVESRSIIKGDSLMIPASVDEYMIKGNATIHKATVPL